MTLAVVVANFGASQSLPVGWMFHRLLTGLMAGLARYQWLEFHSLLRMLRTIGSRRARLNISSIMGFVRQHQRSYRVSPPLKAQCGSTPKPPLSDTVRASVRVNTVHPGYMPPMLNATNAGERADKIAMTPLRRIGKPIEVAYRVLFLASDEASFITGTELVVDGGFIAQ